MKKKLVCIFWGLLLASNSVRATHEGQIYPSSITYTIDKQKFEVSISCIEDGSIKSFTLKLREKSYVVPAGEIEGAGKDFDLSSLRVLVGFGSGGGDAAQQNMDRFTVSLSCGPVTVNSGAGDDAVKSFNEVRFEFIDGKLDCRRRAVSQGDYKMLWKLFKKDPNENEIVNGEEIKSAKNPYRDDS